MSGLYSPINRLAESITRPKGTGAEYMTELQKKPGYKPAEAQDRDLQALMALPQMERAAFMEKLKAQANKFPLKMRELGEGQTHHDQYTLPGGENYREILLHTPMPEGQGFPGVPHHFGGTPNILASVMAKDRISPDGKKILHLEEIQSDWHQQGRDNGYRTSEMEKEIKEVKAWKKRLQHDLRHGGYGMSAQEHEEASEALRKADDELYNLEEDHAKAVPRGPHAKDWHELALKAMIQHAAENGYDQIAINHGKTVADRYSLSKAVKALSYNPDSKYFQAIGHDNQPLINESNADFDRIKELVGKDAAAKLLETPKSLKNHYLETEGLTVGDKGMKKFYDQMVPTFLNKFGKKHGVQVQSGGIQTDEYEMVPDNAGLGMIRSGNKRMAPVHTFDITPSMREDVVKNGIPRYEDGGIIHKAEGGSMNIPSLEQMKALLMRKNSPVGLGVLQSVGVNEAPNLAVKAFLPPQGQDDMSGIPVGGVDIDPMQPGSQFMQPPPQPQGQPPQDGQQPQAGGAPPQGQPAPDNGSNILQMTPQGQAMAAMRPTQPPQPQAMADGGGVSGSGGLQVNIPLTVGGGGGGGQLGGLGGLGETPKMGQFPQPSALGDMAGGTDASPLLPQPLTKQDNSQSNPQDMLQQIMKAFKNAQQSSQQAPDVNQTTGNNKLEGITGMATGGVARFDNGGQPKAKKPTVEEMKQATFQKAQEGLMKPSEVLGKYEGSYLHMTEADRAKVEKRLHGLRGGVGFSEIGLTDPDYKGITWGVGKPGTSIKLLNRQLRNLSPEDKAIWTTFIGTPEMHTSNQLVFNRMWNKFQAARKAGLLSPEQEEKMLDILRSAMTKGTKKSPPKAIFETDANFDSPHHLFDTFERRRVLSDLMAGNKVGGKKGQIFNASQMIEDTTDPRLLHAPTLSVGPNVFTMSGERSVRPDLNKAFPHMLHGEVDPDSFQQIPFEHAAPDFVKEIKQSKGRAPGYMDIVRRIPRQHITEDYLTGLQKIGKKKGGGVKLHADQDTMTLELSRKKKAK